ncbi:MAG TPA: hypothetical protein VGL93_34770 [Streptosporangiaceae bacterium]|jgi:hypothetical protein
MSSRARRHPPRRPRIQVAPPRGQAAAPPEHVTDALEMARPLPETTAALDAEMIVSDAAGWCALQEMVRAAGGERPGDLFDAGADDRAWGELVTAASARPSRRGVALLRGMAAVLPGESGERAASAVRATPDPYVPAWYPAITDLRVTTCWYGEAADNAAYAFLLAAYTYGDGEPHAVALSVDHANGGVAKDVFVAAGADIEVTRDRLSGFCEAFGEVDAATAHGHLADAYAAAARSEYAMDDAVYSLRVLCARRVREFAG